MCVVEVGGTQGARALISKFKEEERRETNGEKWEKWQDAFVSNTQLFACETQSFVKTNLCKMNAEQNIRFHYSHRGREHRAKMSLKERGDKSKCSDTSSIWTVNYSAEWVSFFLWSCVIGCSFIVVAGSNSKCELYLSAQSASILLTIKRQTIQIDIKLLTIPTEYESGAIRTEIGHLVRCTSPPSQILGQIMHSAISCLPFIFFVFENRISHKD